MNWVQIWGFVAPIAEALVIWEIEGFPPNIPRIRIPKLQRPNRRAKPRRPFVSIVENQSVGPSNGDAGLKARHDDFKIFAT